MLARVVRQSAILFFLALLPALVSGALQFQWNTEEPHAPPDSHATENPGRLDWKKESEDEIRPATARAWGKEVLFVDARSRERFALSHIEGAILLNHEEWETLVPPFLDAWDPDRRIVVYCDGGGCDASRSIADRIRRDLQLKNVYVLKGGLPEWQTQ